MHLKIFKYFFCAALYEFDGDPRFVFEILYDGNDQYERVGTCDDERVRIAAFRLLKAARKNEKRCGKTKRAERGTHSVSIARIALV